MLNALTKEKDNKNWDDSNSNDSGKGEDYPGAGNTIQLREEHVKILGGLPYYLSYVGGRLNKYQCPYSGSMELTGNKDREQKAGGGCRAPKT